MKKNISLTIILLLFFTCAFAQTEWKFSLTGNMIGKAVDSVKLSYSFQKKRQVEKIAVKNGQFKFVGSLTEPVLATLTFSGIKLQAPIARQLYLDEGNIHIKGDLAIDSTIKITGSKTQEEEELFNNLHKPVYAEIKKISDSLKIETDQAKKQLLKKRREGMDEKKNRITYQFFRDHPNSYLSASKLYMMSAIYSFDSVKVIYNGLTAKVKQFTVGKKIAEIIKDTEAVSPGKLAIDFTTIDMNGKQLKLSDFRGKYVVLDFWASWCVPCRNSHPHLIELYNRYKDKGLDIIGVASDDGREAVWKEAITKDGVGIWHHVLAGEDPKVAMKGEKTPSSIMTKYGVMALPTKFLIGPDGKIIMRMVGDGPKALDNKLLEIFKQ